MQDYQEFQARLEPILYEYRDPSDKLGYSLMHTLINQLYRSYTVSGNSIDHFESEFGKTRMDYVHKIEFQYDLNNVPKDKRKSREELLKEYDKKVKNYHSMLEAGGFIVAVQEVIESIRGDRDAKFTISDSLERLVVKKCGISVIDKDDERLNELYKKAIKKDLEAYKLNQAKKNKESIEKLKKTALYVNKPNKVLKTGDRRPVGFDGSLSFGEVFAELNALSKSIEVETIARDINYSGITNEFESRIVKISDYIKEIEDNYNKQYVEEFKSGYTFTQAETDQMNRIRNEAFGHIKRLKKLYKSIVKQEKKYHKTLMEIDAVEDRIYAIDQAIEELSENNNIDRSKAGSYSVFTGTIKLLKEERKKCTDYLTMKYKSLKSNMTDLINDAENMIGIIHDLNVEFDTVIRKGKERKEQEDKRRDQIYDENKQRKAALNEMKDEERKAAIDKIKRNIITQMSLEGFGPRPYNQDGETYEEDYDAYNEIFKGRLISELTASGISFDESDLFNPYGKIEYHTDEEEQKHNNL